MKTESFILLFCLLSICFTQDSENQCKTEFISKLKTKCQSLGSCTLNTEALNLNCLPTSPCSGKSRDDCPKTIPSDFHNKKCEYDSDNSSCNEVNKVCSDYNKAVDGNAISGDICSSLTKETDKGDRCYYSHLNGNLGNSRTCSTHYDSCSSINSLSDKSQTKCEANIPSDLEKKCVWNSDSQCVEAKRTCADYRYLENGWADKDNCNKLEAIDASNGASCVYDQISGCTEAYPCSKWDNTDQATCESQTPLNNAGDDYDYLYRCKYDTSEKKCEKVRKTCDEYNDSSLKRGNTLCSQFSPEDSTNKTCVYSSSGSCTEQYKTCQLYDENDAEKSRDECEGLILDDPNKKCVYIKEEHKCEEGNVYNNCNEYKGSDRKICERILSPKRNSYCVLDKDSVCKERDFFCVEAYDRYDCLIYAKPTDDTKKCVWDGSVCKEEYKGCEDYVEKRSNSQNTCDNLEVYNGKKCYYNSDKCTSKNKKCNEAKSREECKLIEKTGVSDPDRKYCEWDSTSDIGNFCRENYKYCSDYRPTSWPSSSDSTIKSTCKKIKPFNPETNTLDLAYKCTVKDPNVGCEKVPKECSEAGSNKILCDLISPLIKDNRIKYCAFVKGITSYNCVEHYKTCELVDESKLSSSDTSLCDDNIPNTHYFPGICEYTNDNGKYKCKTKSTSFCNLFNTITYQDYQYLCLSINPNCTYSSGSCKNITKSCNGIKFYTQDDNNKAICEAIKPSDEDKICVLKEDKSGCEEVYRESIPFIYADNANSNSNSAFKLNANGIQIILILLSLLF